MDNSAHCVLSKKYKKKDEKYNVKLCVYFNRERHYFQTNFDLTKDEWEKLHSSPLKERKLLEIRKSIQEIEFTANKVLNKTNYINFDSFEESYYNEIHKVKKDTDVYYWFDQYIDFLEKEGRPYSYSEHFKTSKNSLKEFKKKLNFIHITNDFLVKYRRWMENNMEEGDKKKVHSDATYKSYLRDLRTVYNFAILKRGVSKELYPFGKGGFTIGTNTARKYALTKQQIISMKALDLSSDKEMEEARDIFIFQYLTNGINIVDLCKLKEQNIEHTEDGPFIVFQRTKTKETKVTPVIIRSFLSQSSLNIIDKWGNKNRTKNDYIFPYLNSIAGQENNPKVLRDRVLIITRSKNRRLKRLGELLGIEMKITTGIARHSFATVLKSSGIPIIEIKDEMGHSSSQITENFYTDPIDDKRIKEISNKLL